MHPEKAYLPLELARQAEAKRKARLEQARAIGRWALTGFGILFVFALLAVL